MTTEEAYRKIRAYFTRDDAVLAYTGTTCRYRTADGNKCAVGCLIPDELYSQYGNKLERAGSLNGVRDEGLFESIPGLKELVNGDDVEGKTKLLFLATAQRLHDFTAAEHGQGAVALFVAQLDAAVAMLGFGPNSMLPWNVGRLTYTDE